MALAATIGIDPREVPLEGLDPTFTRDRSYLPVREKGLGLVRSADVARSAFVGAMEMAIPRFADHVGPGGHQVTGLFRHLDVVTGSAFGNLRGRWTALINSGLPLGTAYTEAWEYIAPKSATIRASSNSWQRTPRVSLMMVMNPIILIHGYGCSGCARGKDIGCGLQRWLPERSYSRMMT